jgi:two-component system, chemotaxis family, chemotaxis protein CheY
VLLADDNGDTREMYRLYLDMAGYHVEVVADGQEAVAVARRLRPDVIVMDLDMPKVDGWAAMKQLQSGTATARIPIVVLTGHDLKAYLKPAALAAGAVSYVMKPCFPEQLAHEISVRLATRLHHAAGAP